MQKSEQDFSPFSAPGHPLECGSHHDCDPCRVQKYSPVGDLQESPRAPGPGEQVFILCGTKGLADIMAAAYLVLIQSVHECYEAPGLCLLVQRQQRNVSDKNRVKQTGDFQVIAGT